MCPGLSCRAIRRGWATGWPYDALSRSEIRDGFYPLNVAILKGIKAANVPSEGRAGEDIENHVVCSIWLPIAVPHSDFMSSLYHLPIEMFARLIRHAVTGG